MPFDEERLLDCGRTYSELERDGRLLFGEVYDWRLLLLWLERDEVLGREFEALADGRAVVPVLPETPAVGRVVAPLTFALLDELPGVGLPVVPLTLALFEEPPGVCLPEMLA